MHSVHGGPLAGLVAQVLLLAVLAVAGGLTALGWMVGLACGVVTSLLLARGLRRSDARRMGPADWVTLARAILIGGVAALVADSFVGAIPIGLLVGVSSAALALDAVDGWVARRTGTVSELGARFDAESDSFLILVLSVYAGGIVGWWVVAIGAARYVYLVSGWLIEWLHRPLPYRYWRKVVAAVQGIVLTVIAADVLPVTVEVALAVGAMALLAESFGRDVVWQWRRRHEDPVQVRVWPSASMPVSDPA